MTAAVMTDLALLDALARDVELTAAALRVAINIGRRQGSNPDAWPTVATIAKDVGDVDERTVRRAIAQLVARGHLEVEKAGKDTKGRGDRYRLRASTGQPCPELSTGQACPEQSQHRAALAPSTGQVSPSAPISRRGTMKKGGTRVRAREPSQPPPAPPPKDSIEGPGTGHATLHAWEHARDIRGCYRRQPAKLANCAALERWVLEKLHPPEQDGPIDLRAFMGAAVHTWSYSERKHSTYLPWFLTWLEGCADSSLGLYGAVMRARARLPGAPLEDYTGESIRRFASDTPSDVPVDFGADDGWNPAAVPDEVAEQLSAPRPANARPGRRAHAVLVDAAAGERRGWPAPPRTTAELAAGAELEQVLVHPGALEASAAVYMRVVISSAPPTLSRWLEHVRSSAPREAAE